MKMLEISKKATFLLGFLIAGTAVMAQDPVALEEAVVATAESVDIPIYAQMGVSSTTLFIIMNLFTALLLFLMVSMANSTKNILKYKQGELKKKSSGGAKVILGLIGLFASGNAMAAETLESYQGFIPFSDQVFWAYIVIDLVLVMFIVHFAGIVKGSVSDAVQLQRLFRWNKLKRNLTDAVEIEDEASILLDHDYDGIKELDNNLPPWWKYGFYITIVWAVVYISYYHVFQVGNLQQAEYEAAMEEGEREIAEYKAAHPELINEDNVELLTDNAGLMKGKGIYDKNCASCHMEGGRGGVGPNLTDAYWIYGNDIKGVFHTVSEGAQNGMKAWKTDLAPDKIQAVSSYILSLEYISPENGGKEPQGDEK